MRLVRRAADRGRTQDEGVDRHHAFSAGGYHDARWMGWGALRVADETLLSPGTACGVQRRANMELLTYVIDGALLHRDADGVAHVVEAGGLQWVGAGRGCDVDERNASTTQPLRLLQAWIQPDRVNALPVREQVALDDASGHGDWTTLASPDGADGSIAIRQQAWLRLARPAAARLAVPLDASRRHWLQVLRGAVTVDGDTLVAGDAMAVVDEAAGLDIGVDGACPAELLLFDLPA